MTHGLVAIAALQRGLAAQQVLGNVATAVPPASASVVMHRHHRLQSCRLHAEVVILLAVSTQTSDLIVVSRVISGDVSASAVDDRARAPLELDWHVENDIKRAWNATRCGRHKDGGGVLSRVSQSTTTSSAVGRLGDDGGRWLQ